MTVLDAYPWIPDRFSVLHTEQNGAQVVCDCPLRNHDQSRLRLALGDDGRLLLHCFACAGHGPYKLEILRAAGLTWKDCFPAGTEIGRQHQECTAKYLYRDERGELLYMTLRLEPGRNGRDKEFSQRRPNPAFNPLAPVGPDNRKWVASLGDVRRVLYRLPELLRSNRQRAVFVVAGEKDVETLRSFGLIATTNVCGESAEWLESYSDALAGRHVVVIEDADDTGRRHANEVFGSVVRRAETASVVRLTAKDATAFMLAARRRLETSSLVPPTDADVLAEFRRECERAPSYSRATAGEYWQLI